MGSRPRAFQRAIDEVRVKKQIRRFFANKIQVLSNEVCYKVSLRENFHGKVILEPFPYLMFIEFAANITLQSNVKPQSDPPL